MFKELLIFWWWIISILATVACGLGAEVLILHGHYICGTLAIVGCILSFSSAYINLNGDW